MPVDSFQGLYLEEDWALKEKLTGLTVSDVNETSRNVQVYFRLPQQELRTKRFPLAVIDFLDESVASEREHRGPTEIAFVPYTDTLYQYQADATPQQGQIPVPLEGADEFFTLPFLNTPPTVEFPIPIDLHYQVTFFTRSNRHVRQLSSELNDPVRLHPRFAFLNCPGGTVRRIDVLSKTATDNADEESPEKREFRLAYDIRVSSEIMPSVALGTRVQSIVLTVDPFAGSVPQIVPPGPAL